MCQVSGRHRCWHPQCHAHRAKGRRALVYVRRHMIPYVRRHTIYVRTASVHSVFCLRACAHVLFLVLARTRVVAFTRTHFFLFHACAGNGNVSVTRIVGCHTFFNFRSLIFICLVNICLLRKTSNSHRKRDDLMRHNLIPTKAHTKLWNLMQPSADGKKTSAISRDTVGLARHQMGDIKTSGRSVVRLLVCPKQPELGRTWPRLKINNLLGHWGS